MKYLDPKDADTDSDYISDDRDDDFDGVDRNYAFDNDYDLSRPAHGWLIQRLRPCMSRATNMHEPGD